MILVSKNNLIFAQKEKLSSESTPEIKVESFRMAFLIQIKYVNIKKKTVKLGIYSDKKSWTKFLEWRKQTKQDFAGAEILIIASA